MTREEETRRLAGQASDAEPTAWFERLYAAAGSGEAVVPWDHGGPRPVLVQWTARHHLDGAGRTAVVVGCGLGSDAEHLAGLGFRTTAFDVSPTAVAMARERNPGSQLDYATADLLDLPAQWRASYDFVLESLTVQSLPISLHERAATAVRSLVAPGGTLLVLAVHREEGSAVDGPPWPLTESEVHAFASPDVHVQQAEVVDDPEGVDRRWWRVELRRDPD